MKQSPEFRLAVQCCQQSFGQRAKADGLALQSGIDWPRFVRLVSFHRIEGLAWNALVRNDRGVPGDVSRTLTKAVADIAAHNLHSVAKSGALLRKFEEANVPLLFLKGPSLGSLAYSNPQLKSAIDIDLLIDPDDLERSIALLRGCGFRLIAPTGGNIAKWHRKSKESVWKSDNPSLQLDLHTRVADNKWLIPSIDVHSPVQTVDVGNDVRLPTLAANELVAYLSVHGASSAWFRLKWISDFAGLIHKCDGDELVRIYRRSNALGAGRCAGQALLLADALFSTLDPAPALRDALSQDRAIVSLYRNALRFLTKEKGEPTGRRWGTFTIHWTQLSLQSGLRFKSSELSRQAGRLFNH